MIKDNFNQEIGGRIREIREFSHFTRETLAEKADIYVQFLADIEMGRKSMTIKTLKKISESLSVSSDYILFGKINSQTHSSEESKINILIENMTPEHRRDVEDIIKIFAHAINKIDTSSHSSTELKI